MFLSVITVQIYACSVFNVTVHRCIGPFWSFCVLSLISSRVSAGARQLLYISLCVWSCLCQIVVFMSVLCAGTCGLLCSWFLKWLSPFVWTHAYSSKNNACYGVQLRFLWIFLLRSPVTRSAQHTIRNTCRWVELGYPGGDGLSSVQRIVSVLWSGRTFCLCLSFKVSAWQ